MNDYFIIFGGIFEITKELNDMYIYDMKERKWLCIFEETNCVSPVKLAHRESEFKTASNSA